MAQCFCDRQVGIVKLNIFSHQSNGDNSAAVIDLFYEFFPFFQVRFGCFDPQLPADDSGEILLFQHQRCFVQNRDGNILNDTVWFDIAEHTDFLENAVFQGFIAAQNDDIRLDTHTLQLTDRVLGGFAFVFVGATEEGNQSYMDKEAVFFSYL